MFEIIKRIIKAQIRRPKSLIFNMIFPIFLMSLVGTILIRDFENDYDIEPITVYYCDNGSNKSKDILSEVKKIDEGVQLNFTKIDSVEDGKNNVKIDKGGFVHLDGDEIKIYVNNKRIIESGVVTSVFKTVGNRLNTVNEVYAIDNVNAERILSKKDIESYIAVDKIPKTKSPSSFDYYGIVELTMMSMYVFLYPLYGIKRDKNIKVKSRIHLSKLSVSKYYIANIIGYFIISIIITLPGYLFSIFVLNTNWGPNLLISFLIILSLNLMVISLGIILGEMLNKKDNVIIGIDNIILPLMSFLGGSYIALPAELPTGLQIATSLSPLRWINVGFFNMIYSNDNSMIIMAVSLNILITIVSLITLTIFVKKEGAC
ncbi:MAG: ABC transporter permease [Clostridium sp.]